MGNCIGVFAVLGIIVFAVIMVFGWTAEVRHAARWSKSIHRVYNLRSRRRPPLWIAWIVTAAGMVYYLWLLREWLLSR